MGGGNKLEGLGISKISVNWGCSYIEVGGKIEHSVIDIPKIRERKVWTDSFTILLINPNSRQEI